MWMACCSGGETLVNYIKIKTEKRYLRSQPFESHVFPLDKRSGLTTTNTYRHIYTDGTFMMFCEFLKTITISYKVCVHSLSLFHFDMDIRLQTVLIVFFSQFHFCLWCNNFTSVSMMNSHQGEDLMVIKKVDQL